MTKGGGRGEVSFGWTRSASLAKLIGAFVGAPLAAFLLAFALPFLFAGTHEQLLWLWWEIPSALLIVLPVFATYWLGVALGPRIPRSRAAAIFSGLAIVGWIVAAVLDPIAYYERGARGPNSHRLAEIAPWGAYTPDGLIEQYRHVVTSAPDPYSRRAEDAVRHPPNQVASRLTTPIAMMLMAFIGGMLGWAVSRLQFWLKPSVDPPIRVLLTWILYTAGTLGAIILWDSSVGQSIQTSGR